MKSPEKFTDLLIFKQDNLPKRDILDHLRGRYKEYVITQILDHLRMTPSINKVLVLGAPGNGKTAIVSSLRRRFREFQWVTTQVSFDMLRSTMMDEGFGSTRLWSHETWLELSQRMYQELQTKLTEPTPTGRRSLSIVEFPGVGRKDRGFHLARLLAQEENRRVQEGLPQSLLILCVVADSEIPKRAREVRRFVVAHHSANSQDLTTKLLDKYKIDVGAEFDNTSESGQEIISIFEQMANDDFIKQISEELAQLTMNWVVNTIRENPNAFPQFIHASYAPDTEDDADKAYMLLTAGYLQHLMINELKLPLGYFYILYNLFVDEIIQMNLKSTNL